MDGEKKGRTFVRCCALNHQIHQTTTNNDKSKINSRISHQRRFHSTPNRIGVGKIAGRCY